jgi:hypothetical protein
MKVLTTRKVVCSSKIKSCNTILLFDCQTITVKPNDRKFNHYCNLMNIYHPLPSATIDSMISSYKPKEA